MLFPAPELPTRATRSPSPITRSMPSRTRGSSGPIPEGDPSVGDFTSDGTGQHHRMLGSQEFPRVADEVEDPLGSPGCFLQVSPEAGQETDGSSNGHGVKEKGHQISRRQNTL